MKLSKVIEGITPVSVRGSLDVDIKGVCHDSRHFQPGDLFVAIRGNQFDGHLFVGEACERGASALVVEDDRVVTVRYSGPVIKVKNTRKDLNLIASNFFENPSASLFMVGITGTNGKTSTTHMVEAILNANKMPTGVIGTIDNHLGAAKIPSTHTTPDAIALQGLLRTWLNAEAKAVAMEVSSHALALARVDSVLFDVAILTNITRDHLDFHKTMDEYIKAKARLFRELLKKSPKPKKRIIVNAEDTHLDSILVESIPTWKYGFSKGDIRAENLELSFFGSKFTAVTPAGKELIELPMIGRPFVANSLAAIGVGLHLGMSLPTIAEALKKMKPVKGRLERVPTKQNLHVFVDYAHSDDALKNVLQFIRKLRDESSAACRIITVFGCGGDRDRGKRPMMMKTAEALSDIVYVTSDNPRTEDPKKIIDEILAGRQNQGIGEDMIFAEVDRKKAIELAIKRAKPGDVILVAGKGHEDYQIIGTKKIHFDDVEVAKEFLKE